MCGRFASAKSEGSGERCSYNQRCREPREIVLIMRRSAGGRATSGVAPSGNPDVA